MLKLHGLQEERSEVVFQRYRFALAEWSNLNPELDLSDLRRPSLVFDQTAASAIILEHLTWSPAGL